MMMLALSNSVVEDILEFGILAFVCACLLIGFIIYRKTGGKWPD